MIVSVMLMFGVVVDGGVGGVGGGDVDVGC